MSQLRTFFTVIGVSAVAVIVVAVFCNFGTKTQPPTAKFVGSNSSRDVHTEKNNADPQAGTKPTPSRSEKPSVPVPPKELPITVLEAMVLMDDAGFRFEWSAARDDGGTQYGYKYDLGASRVFYLVEKLDGKVRSLWMTVEPLRDKTDDVADLKKLSKIMVRRVTKRAMPDTLVDAIGESETRQAYVGSYLVSVSSKAGNGTTTYGVSIVPEK